MALSLGGCATLRDSLILGAGSGVAAGAIVGRQTGKDPTENAIKGAVIGGLVVGIASYVIHGSLENRDERVRRETLMNLESFDVMGVQSSGSRVKASKRDGNCYQAREVDGRMVSVPCGLTGSFEESGSR